MSQISNTVTELNKINQEIKRHRADIKKLNERKAILDNEIKDFLNQKNQPGLKYQGVAIVMEDATKHKYKKKDDKKKDCCELLRDYGINNPEDAFEKILSSLKGEEETMTKLKIKKLK
jgi:hypothetical protein